MSTKKNKIRKMLEASVREEKKEQGFFDGRFNNRSYRSKKTYSRKSKYKRRIFE